ncbi:hypothetical protein DPEC_G00178080 [Dallia pectoralis]|uniref:Uncharacterized protein n=1 Tax=Dallia pectoralis TaxID=75939 RepID=A0ACC2GEW0_DALPE|nr:hypothetical protein DPEC_G00178080 [Dallia pectoralis]
MVSGLVQRYAQAGAAPLFCSMWTVAAAHNRTLRVKREPFRRDGGPLITNDLVDKAITEAELSKFCRRRTHGEDMTIHLIEQLLQELMGEKGDSRNSLKEFG